MFNIFVSNRNIAMHGNSRKNPDISARHVHEIGTLENLESSKKIDASLGELEETLRLIAIGEEDLSDYDFNDNGSETKIIETMTELLYVHPDREAVGKILLRYTLKKLHVKDRASLNKYQDVVFFFDELTQAVGARQISLSEYGFKNQVDGLRTWYINIGTIRDAIKTLVSITSDSSLSLKSLHQEVETERDAVFTQLLTTTGQEKFVYTKKAIDVDPTWVIQRLSELSFSREEELSLILYAAQKDPAGVLELCNHRVIEVDIATVSIMFNNLLAMSSIKCAEVLASAVVATELRTQVENQLAVVSPKDYFWYRHTMKTYHGDMFLEDRNASDIAQSKFIDELRTMTPEDVLAYGYRAYDWEIENLDELRELRMSAITVFAREVANSNFFNEVEMSYLGGKVKWDIVMNKLKNIFPVVNIPRPDVHAILLLANKMAGYKADIADVMYSLCHGVFDMEHATYTIKDSDVPVLSSDVAYAMAEELLELDLSADEHESFFCILILNIRNSELITTLFSKMQKNIDLYSVNILASLVKVHSLPQENRDEIGIHIAHKIESTNVLDFKFIAKCLRVDARIEMFTVLTDRFGSNMYVEYSDFQFTTRYPKDALQRCIDAEIIPYCFFETPKQAHDALRYRNIAIVLQGQSTKKGKEMVPYIEQWKKENAVAWDRIIVPIITLTGTSDLTKLLMQHKTFDAIVDFFQADELFAEVVLKDRLKLLELTGTLTYLALGHSLTALMKRTNLTKKEILHRHSDENGSELHDLDYDCIGLVANVDTHLVKGTFGDRHNTFFNTSKRLGWLSQAPDPGVFWKFLEAHYQDIDSYFDSAIQIDSDALFEYLSAKPNPEVVFQQIVEQTEQYGTWVPWYETTARNAREFLIEAQHDVKMREDLSVLCVDGEKRDFTKVEGLDFEIALRKRLQEMYDVSSDMLEAASLRNRELATNAKDILPGTLLHYSSIDSLPKICMHGNLCGECIGLAMHTDGYPFFVDTLQVPIDGEAVLIADIYNKNRKDLLYQMGGVCILYENRVSSEHEQNIDSSHMHHHLVFGGIPRHEVTGIVFTSEAYGEEGSIEEQKKFIVDTIVDGDMYIPVYDEDGNLIFTFEEFMEASSEQKPMNLEQFLAHDYYISSLEGVQQPAVHEFDAKEHTLQVVRAAEKFCDAYHIHGTVRIAVQLAARLHDIGKGEEGRENQQIHNVRVAEERLRDIYMLPIEIQTQTLTLIRFDELLGEILSQMELVTSTEYTLTEAGKKAFSEFNKRFATPEGKKALLALYQADIVGIGNEMYKNWQIAEKLGALELLPENFL